MRCREDVSALGIGKAKAHCIQPLPAADNPVFLAVVAKLRHLRFCRGMAMQCVAIALFGQLQISIQRKYAGIEKFGRQIGGE